MLSKKSLKKPYFCKKRLKNLIFIKRDLYKETAKRDERDARDLHLLFGATHAGPRYHIGVSSSILILTGRSSLLHLYKGITKRYPKNYTSIQRLHSKMFHVTDNIVPMMAFQNFIIEGGTLALLSASLVFFVARKLFLATKPLKAPRRLHLSPTSVTLVAAECRWAEWCVWHDTRVRLSIVVFVYKETYIMWKETCIM